MVGFLPSGRSFDAVTSNETSLIYDSSAGYAPEEEEIEEFMIGAELQTSTRRKLAYPVEVVVVKYGFTWVYYVDSYFW